MKKVLSVLLSIVMLLSVTTGVSFDANASTNGHSQAEAVAWAKSMADNHTYCGECVALIQKYYAWLGVSVPNTNANTYANADHIPPGWYVDNTPSLGAVYVEANSSPGHVCVVVGIDSAGTLTTVDSNVTGTSVDRYKAQYFPWTTGRKKSDYSGVQGKYFVHPDFNNDNGSPISGGTQTVSDGEYHIVSALNRNMGLDAEDGKTANDTNICLYNNIEDSTQTFILNYLGDGFYSIIHKKSQKSLDVNMASTANRTNVKLYTYSGNDAQRWVIQTSGDGYFYIKSKCNGLCVDIDNASTANKTNIQMYSENGTNAQKWAFIAAGGTQSIPNGNYHIVSALNSNYGLDVYGCENKNGTNVQLYNNKGDTNQVFNVNYDKKGYYTITHNKTGKVLDMYNSGTYFGTNVNIYAYNGTDAQKWIIKSVGKGYYNIIAKNSGLYIDVKDGKVANYNNIWGYIGNPTNAQKWKFVCATHTWNSGVTAKKATCSATGTILYTCSACGETKTETIKATGHNEVTVKGTPATFKAAGKTDGKKCSVCGKITVAQQKIAKLGSPKLSKVEAGRKQFKASWKSIKSIDGYQIQYSSSSSFKSGNKTVTVKGSKSSKTVKSLKAKKKYYVRIRGYKTINGKKQYSAWSAKKSVTTKK